MTLTARDIAARIEKSFGTAWKGAEVDSFLAGSPDTVVTGIATTYAPSLEVLRIAAANGQNLIISRESPFWARSPKQLRPGPGAPSPRIPVMDNDPTYRDKRDYIAANKLVLFRLFENWDARPADAQLHGLAKALGWEPYYKPSGGSPWATGNGFFALPPSTLQATARSIKSRLGAKGIRVGGNPAQRVTKAALSHGMYWLNDLHAMIAEPGVDLIVVGEPQWENELSQYSFDMADAGMNIGMIVLGQAVSEDPGSGEMASWLRSVVTEVPVAWIRTGDPSWMPY